MFSKDYFFLQIEPKTWNEILIISEKIKTWIFRGQSDASWRIETALHRSANNNGCPIGIIANREYEMVRRFKRRAHLYCNYVPQDENTIEWLALMQHHGCPTRLVDFSYSFFTGLYFALVHASSDAALWGIQLRNMEEFIEKRLPDSIEYKKMVGLEKNAFHIRIFNEVFGKNASIPSVINVEPEVMNERLSVQQGLFLVPCKFDMTFQENLSGMCEIEPTIWDNPKIITMLETMDVLYGIIIKIIIPKNIRNECMRNLEIMNITEESLFPGLDGYARSLEKFLRF